jgi:hypothetical protein
VVFVGELWQADRQLNGALILPSLACAGGKEEENTCLARYRFSGEVYNGRAVFTFKEETCEKRSRSLCFLLPS